MEEPPWPHQLSGSAGVLREGHAKMAEGAPLDAAYVERCNAVWKKLRGLTPKLNR